MTAVALWVTAVSIEAHKTVVSPFTYYGDIQPLIDRRCASCHNGGAKPSITFSAAAEGGYPFQQAILTHRRIDVLSAVELDMLLTWSAGGSPEGPRPAGVPAPPPRHASHAPEHGGMVVPMFDDTLHVEAIWQEQRRFRMRVTDAAGQPLDAARLSALDARVGVGEERAAFTPSADPDLIEARVATTTLPAAFVLRLRGSDGREAAATFFFPAYSMPPPSFEVPPTPIPTTPLQIVAAIREQAAIARDMVGEFRSGMLYVPTTHVRNLVLALTARATAGDAVLEPLMRATWRLHLAGDAGLNQEIRAALVAFNTAVEQLAASSPKGR